METVPSSFLELVGLTCPIPLLRTKKHLRTMGPGEVVKVVATDPDTRADFDAFCDGVVCELLSVSVEGNTLQYLIRKV